TLRRHLESTHRAEYLKWCEENKFQSMLPRDTKWRRDQMKADSQSSLDSHLQERLPPKERVIPYSDVLFREAAVEWLVATDQPIQALEHLSFKSMIEIAARATNGVRIPD
ncbi:hypothetical protein WOLCODRAFT_55268, partial [Wolfiporia cocos MD-104 SS10]